MPRSDPTTGHVATALARGASALGCPVASASSVRRESRSSSPCNGAATRRSRASGRDDRSRTSCSRETHERALTRSRGRALARAGRARALHESGEDLRRSCSLLVARELRLRRICAAGATMEVLNLGNLQPRLNWRESARAAARALNAEAHRRCGRPRARRASRPGAGSTGRRSARRVQGWRRRRL